MLWKTGLRASLSTLLELFAHGLDCGRRSRRPCNEANVVVDDKSMQPIVSRSRTAMPKTFVIRKGSSRLEDVLVRCTGIVDRVQVPHHECLYAL